MNGQPRLYMDQYGECIFANTVKELCKKAGRTKANKMYADKIDGTVVHCGYVVGYRWFNMFAPVEIIQ